MKKMYNFAFNMDNTLNNMDLLNYELKSSNSNNYWTTQNTSSPESFPVLMENGIIVEYELVNFSTQILEELKVVED